MEAEDIAKEIEQRAKRLSPTRIAQASRCLHWHYLEEHGDHSKKLPESAGLRLAREQGLEFESQDTAGLKDVYEPEWDGKNFEQGFEATISLFKKGVPWIHGGVLIGDGLVGVPDLLKRTAGRSKFGRYAYMPIEIKNHKEVQERDTIQLTAYGVLLETALGSPCKKGGVWLNTNEIEDVDIQANLPLFKKIREEMERVRTKRLTTEPIWCSACTTCPWLGYCKDTWVKLDHISLLPNGGKSTIQKLYPVGIKTVKALAQGDPKEIARRTRMTVGVAQKLWLHAKARVAGKPLVVKKPHFRDDVPNIFWDIETHGGTIFLHGLIRVFKGKREEKFFFADSPDHEARAWHDFLDYVARDDDCAIWSWTDYERGPAAECWKKHRGNEKGYKLLMKRLMDQCKWTRDHFVFPARSYSIKAVAPVFGFKWKDEDASGLSCEAWYASWLESKENALKGKILEYNRDDVLAMEVIYDNLKRISGGHDGTGH